MNHHQLKERALAIAKPSKSFQIMFEEINAQPGEESLFIWGDNQESIKVQLDYDGTLKSYFISKESYEVPVDKEISQEERYKLAEQFLLQYYPNALADFTFYKVEPIDEIEQFHYGQLVMDLPLANAGIIIGLDKAGNLVELMHMGKLSEPEIPKKLVGKKALYENAKKHIRMRLAIAEIAGQLRLIYELDDVYPVYQADILEPVINEQRCNIHYEILPSLGANFSRSLEDIIGVSSGMQIIDEITSNNVKRIVWAEKKGEDLYEDTVHARIDMNTGQLLSMTWFKERQGNLQLNEKEALQNAVTFLQHAAPEMYPYLQLEVDKNRQYPRFMFRLIKAQNIKTHFMVSVTINCSTGDVESFHGRPIDMEQFEHVPSVPAISAQQAKNIFLAHLDFRLEWGMGNAIGSSVLRYDCYDKKTGKVLGYIDALDGTVITFQD
ncbi:YcdB/YcdC domain-containing protein [Bacillus ndiopicus]|uniref:YcdB/YcdC domain-containing protein n=1 Tax=Bacillus ndiopicus TaxID=1347368 RepID=UPI0005A95096|nr:YcdB/YcdC domain-containing protein [Bacillus ndiopicus]